MIFVEVWEGLGMGSKSSNEPKNKAATAKKRVRKPRRQLPEDMGDLYLDVGEKPTLLDIVSGRGGGANHHPGNRRYWEHVLSHRSEYKLLCDDDKAEKHRIAVSIMKYLAETGRFLQKETRTGRWYRLPTETIIVKIKQALRDEYVPKFARQKATKVAEEPKHRTPSPTPPASPKMPRSELAFDSADFAGLLSMSNPCANKSQQCVAGKDGPSMGHFGSPPNLEVHDLFKQSDSGKTLGDLLSATKAAIPDAFGSYDSIHLAESVDHMSIEEGPADDLKIEYGNLGRGCLDNALSGHSLELFATGDGYRFPGSESMNQNSVVVPKTVSQLFRSQFDKVFAA